jgi:hypothetical protein
LLSFQSLMSPDSNRLKRMARPGGFEPPTHSLEGIRDSQVIELFGENPFLYLFSGGQRRSNVLRLHSQAIGLRTHGNVPTYIECATVPAIGVQPAW